MAKSNPFRFSTRFYDDDSSLIYYLQRYYNSSTGRWISRDSSQESDGNNLYAFLGNRPLDLVDPDGAGKWWDRITSGIILAGSLLGGTGPEGTPRPLVDRTPMSQRVLQDAELEKKLKGRTGKSGNAGSGSPGGKGAGIMIAASLLYVMSGQAEADAKELTGNLLDYMRDKAQGDEAMADLDAATASVNITVMTGDSVVGLAVWGMLQE